MSINIIYLKIALIVVLETIEIAGNKNLDQVNTGPEKTQQTHAHYIHICTMQTLLTTFHTDPYLLQVKDRVRSRVNVRNVRSASESVITLISSPLMNHA